MPPPQQDPNLLLKSNTYPAVCAPLAALCVAAILATLGLLCKRLLWSRANGWRWTSKQRASGPPQTPGSFDAI